jgi:hypothetical protein
MSFVAFSLFPSLELVPDEQTEVQPFPTWIFPLHLTSMVGMFYGLWFTAKQFTTYQHGRDVSFLEYSGPFFLFWFSPIGVWFLQPKVNQLPDRNA